MVYFMIYRSKDREKRERERERKKQGIPAVRGNFITSMFVNLNFLKLTCFTYWTLFVSHYYSYITLIDLAVFLNLQVLVIVTEIKSCKLYQITASSIA